MLEADKGKTFVVVDEATYRAMADDHISADPVVTQEEVRESQMVLTSTGKSLANILNLGMNQSYKNYIRCFDNTGSVAEDVPNLKLLPKVHKPPAPAGHPQSRPVVAAASGLSSRAGDLISDFLEPMIAADLPRQEDLSTEEVLSQLEEAQVEIKRLGLKDTMAGSLDVRALYPSLDQERAAESVAKFVRRSKVKVEGVDWREAQVFLASNMDEHEQKREGVLGLLPRRLKKWGARPGNKTEELRRRLPDPKGDNPGQRPTKWASHGPGEGPHGPPAEAAAVTGGQGGHQERLQAPHVLLRWGPQEAGKRRSDRTAPDLNRGTHRDGRVDGQVPLRRHQGWPGGPRGHEVRR